MNSRFLLLFAVIVLALPQCTLSSLVHRPENAINAAKLSEHPPQSPISASDSFFNLLATGCEPVSDFSATRNTDANLDTFDFEFGFTVAPDVSCLPGTPLALAVGMPNPHLLTRAVDNSVVCTEVSSGTPLAHKFSNNNAVLEVTLTPSLLGPGRQSIRVVFQTTASAPALSSISLNVIDSSGISFAATTNGPFTATISEPGVNHVDESAITKMQVSSSSTGVLAIAMSFPDSQHIPSVQGLSYSITGDSQSLIDCDAYFWGKDADGEHRLFRYETASQNEIDGIVVNDLKPLPWHATSPPPVLFNIGVVACSGGPEVGSSFEVTFSVGSSTRVRMGTLVVPTRDADPIIESYVRASTNVAVSDDKVARRMSLLNDRGARALNSFFGANILEGHAIYYDFDYESRTSVMHLPLHSSAVMASGIYNILSSFLFDEIIVPAVIQPLYASLSPVTIDTVSVMHSKFGEITVMCEPPPGTPSPNNEPNLSHCSLKKCSTETTTVSFCQFGPLASGNPRLHPRECKNGRVISLWSDMSACADSLNNLGVELEKVDDTTLDMLVQVKSATGEIESSSLTLSLTFSSAEVITPEFSETVLAEVFVIDANGDDLFESLGVFSAGTFTVSFSSNKLSKRRVRFSGVDPADLSSKIYAASDMSIKPAGVDTPGSYYASSARYDGTVFSDSALSIRIAFYGRSDPVAGVALRFQSPGWTMGAGCATVAEANSDTGSTNLFPTWPAPTLDTSFAGIDGKPFYHIPVSATPSETRYVHIRCEGVFDESLAAYPDVAVAFIADDNRTLYGMHNTPPVNLSAAYSQLFSEYYLGMAARDTSTATVADVTPLLEQLVPSEFKNMFKVGAVSSDPSDPNGRVARVMFYFTVDSFMMFPLYMGTVAHTFRNVLGVELAVMDDDGWETLAVVHRVDAHPIGDTLCEAPNTDLDAWRNAGSCSVTDNCGNEYANGHVSRCVLRATENSPVSVLDPSSVEARTACVFSPPSPTLPMTSGCGTFLCKHPVTDEFVPCDAPSQCIPGCRADVPITGEMVDSEPAFSYSCVKNNTRVDSALCFQSGPVTYAPTCNAVSTCAAVCTDHDDEDTDASESTSPGKRVACDSEAAWRACDICGADGQKLRYQCADSNSPMGSPVTPVPESFCSFPDDFATSRTCSGPTCSSYQFACRSDANATWAHCSENDGSFGSCSEHCGDGTHSREIACALFTSARAITGEPNASDFSACSSEPTPELKEACNDGACPPDRWACTTDADPDTPVPCETVLFPPCPTGADTDGCFEPKVNRSVHCFSGKHDTLLSDDACTDSRPDDTLVCAPVTSACVPGFLDSTPCIDADNTVHTCLIPGTDASTAGFTRTSSCLPSADATEPVPSEWCSSLPPPAACAASLPACQPSGSRWVETAADECYTGNDATCRSYRTITAVCEVKYGTGEWQEATDASVCASLPPHRTEENCDNMPSCSNHGQCVTPSGGSSNIGVCECTLGFSGDFCDSEGSDVLVTLASAGTGFEGKYIISWFLPSTYTVSTNATAVVSLVLQGDVANGGGIALSVATVAARSDTLMITAFGLVLEGTYKARVVAADMYSGESNALELSPGCLAGGAAACDNDGECVAKSGACTCKGDWTGSQCNVSPCDGPTAAAVCNPEGGVCAMSNNNAVCTCHADPAGTPLFEAPSCHIPTNGCSGNLPSCAHGGVRSGSLSSSGEAQCTDCVCENKWTSASNCATCGLSCLNGGKRDDNCSKCTCLAKSGYNGDSCECRHIRMSFVVLSASLPFTEPSAVLAAEKTRLLDLFSSAFASELSHLMRVSVTTVESVSEHTASEGTRYIRLSFLVNSHCPSTAGTAVTDHDLMYAYDGVNELKAILSEIHASSFYAAALVDNTHVAPSVALMHPAAGFSARDPNCRLGDKICPSGWGGNGVLPGETEGGEGEGEGEGEGGVSAGKSSSLSTGAIVGIAVGSAVGLIILIIVILCVAGVIGGGAAARKGSSPQVTEMTSV